MKELQYLAADVICLQEVTPSYFDATLVPALRELGYEGNIKKRLGDFDEGEATFYRTSRFELVESIGHGLRDLIFKDVEGLNEDIKAPVRSVLMESSQSVVLLTKLKCKHTGSSLTVGNVHVSWGRLQAPDIQCLEVCAAVKELVSMAGGVLQPHLICGDFNSPPLTPAYQVVSDGYLDDRNMAILQSLTKVQLAESKDALVNLLWKGFQHTANSLKSVYKHITGDEPFSSNFPHDKTLRAVDYQWFSSNTVVGLGVLAAVDPNLIKSGIPNEIFPSDHLSTKARYSFK
jgi:CCR4-NOT transcription complex subunit 6